MKIYMIRHGETDWNKKRKLQGQVDIPLNEFGKLLAKETAPALADVPFAVCYTSPLKRAAETARLVLGDREVPIVPDKRIQEMSFGEFEGLCCREEGWNIPDPGFRNFFNAPEVYQPPKGGESFEEVRARLNNFLEELYQKEEYKDSNILITTHGAALAGLLNNIKKRPLAEYWGVGVHKNCAVTEVLVEEGVPRIIFENKVYYDDVTEPWEDL